jgi:hypothetical protein
MTLLPLLAAALFQLSGPTPDAMNGAWAVDLSADPAQPYVKSMHLTLAADGTVSGDFYDSTIEAGRWKAQNRRVCVSFRTSDGVGPYHTAGCLTGDRIEGQTWAEHRDFVFVWNAARGEPAA